jgi:hypothetical protein
MQEQIEQLTKKIEELQRQIAVLSVANVVEWQDRQTDSGIQLTAGPTTVPRRGTVMTTLMAQGQDGKPLIALVVKRDDGVFLVLPADQTKPVTA